MSQESSDDKQFDASESKLRKARQEGDVPRSAELQSALMYLGFWFAALFASAWAAPAWIGMAARALGGEPWPDGEGRTVTDVDILTAAHKQRLVPLDHPLVKAARDVGTGFGD